MSKRLHVSAVLVLLIVLGLFTTAFAQGVTGTLTGQVIDDASRSPVTDVMVIATDPRTGLKRNFWTDANGKFWLDLPPGLYSLKADKDGYRSIAIGQVAVNVGDNPKLTLPIKDNRIDEIEVYAKAIPLMEMATGETALNMSLVEVAQLPVSRDIESVALMAPGTVPGIVAFGDDKTLVSFGGSSVAENIYYIDGLNVTDFRNGLGGASVPFEFYDHFQIKTGGYSAEFGRSTGGVLNSVTKRGGNEFEFGAVAYYEPSEFRSQSPDTLLSDGSYYDLNSENSQSSWTTDLYVSGPIIKDRLFFFVLYEPQNTEEQYNSSGSPDRLNIEKITDSFWGGNLTWNITDSHALSATAFSDQRDIVKEVYGYDVENMTAGDKFGESTSYRGGDNYIIHYTGQITEDFFVSAQYGKNEYDLTDQSSNDVECPVIVDATDASTSRLPGCWIDSSPQIASDEREAYRLDLKYYVGNHKLRAGFDREDNGSQNALTYSGLSYTPDLIGGAYYRYESWDVGDQLPNGGIVPDANGDGSRVDTVRFRYWDNTGSFSTTSEAWYVDDTWEINDQFTIGIGIRNETFKNYNGVGEEFFKIDDQWAPRIVLSWSPAGNVDQRITMNWGRYHLPILTFPVIGLGSAYLEYERYFVFDGNTEATTAAPIALDDDGIPTTPEIGSVFIRADGTVPDTRSVLDTTLEPMYQDELIIAYERDLGDEWVAGIRYVRRELQSLIEDITVDAGLEAMGFPGAIGLDQPCWVVMTNPGTDVNTFCDSDGDGILEETLIPAELLGFPEAKRTYDAIELTAKKLFNGRWSMQGSYTWSKNQGNTEGSVKSDNSQSGANMTADFDLPQFMDGADGYLPNDRRHKIKLWGLYQFTDRLSLSANLFAQSGRPINAFGRSHPDGTPWWGSTFYLQQPDDSFELVPRGTVGRTDWITQINLAAIYAFEWRDDVNIALRAEVFNLLDADSAQEVYEYPEESPELFRLPKSYQQPRYLRLGASVRF